MSISLLVAAVALAAPVSAPAHPFHAGHAFHAHAVASAQMVTVRGRVVCQGADPAALECLFDAGEGKRYPLSRVVTSRALFEDANLRAKDLEVTGQIDASGRLEVIQTRSIKNGVLYDVYYWCETCHIRSPFGGDCWCCFQPFEFKEVLIQKL